MKKYSGGVLSLVFVLCLLRTNDIDEYFNELYGDISTNSDISEIILGPLAGYTQSTYGRRLHDPDYFGSHQRKDIEYMRSVLQDIHALSRYRRFDGIDTTIDAWWHTSIDAQQPVDNTEETDEDYESDEADSASPATANSDSVDEWQSDTDNAACELERLDLDRPQTQDCVGELSREDMDLIDILWRQDIDLGIAKEFYDYDVKKKSEAVVAEQTVLETLVNENDLLQSFSVDHETGEYLFPMPQAAITALPEQPSVAGEQQMVEQSEEELENQLIQLLQFAAADNSAAALPAEMASYAVQRMASTESLAVSQGDLHMLDDLDIDALLQPVSGGHMMERQASVETQLSQLMSLWTNSSAPQPQHHQLPAALLRGNVSMTTNNASSWLPAELLNESVASVNTDLLAGATFTPSASLANVTDMWPDSLLTQLLSDPATAIEGVTDTSAEGAVAMAQQDVDASQKFVGAWTSGAAYSVGGATSGDDDGASSYSGTELPIKKEADEWHQGASYDNATQTNTTGRYVTASGRVSRRSTSSSVMSDDSLDSMIGAQHNHTYPSQARSTEPRVATVRMRAAATTTAEEDEENAMASRDVKRLNEMHIPLRYEDIVSTPVEKFNRLLQNHHLTDAQVQFIRDVRRRGKNKMAAQNCRKRKLDVINNLDSEVVMLQQRRVELQREQAFIAHRADDIKMKMRELEEAIMRSLNPDNRLVHDSVRLQLTSDGALYVVPATNSSLTDENQSNNNNRKKKGSKKQ